MQCEICGRETTNSTKIVLDGSHLAVCEDCSSYGKPEPTRPSFQRTQTAAVPRKRILEIEDDIAPGFGKLIRHAREQRGWTIDELGKKVFEKASFLHRIEAESVKPYYKLTKKLESALGIKIISRE